MNPEEIKDWAQASTAVLASIRAAIGMLPSGEKREQAHRLLERAELDFKQAEADAARQLGFDICPRCWPPEIMLLADDEKPKCRGCGKNPLSPDNGFTFGEK